MQRRGEERNFRRRIDVGDVIGDSLKRIDDALGAKHNPATAIVRKNQMHLRAVIDVVQVRSRG
jgi:hypothetical protein